MKEGIAKISKTKISLIFIFSILIIGVTSFFYLKSTDSEKFVVSSKDLPGYTESIMLNNYSEKIVTFSGKNGNGFVITQMQIPEGVGIENAIKIANSMSDESNNSENYSVVKKIDKFGDYSLTTIKINSYDKIIDSAVIFIKGKNLIKIVSLNGEESLGDVIELAKIIEKRI